MKPKYIFRLGKKSDIPQVLTLIETRISWMNAEGIQQWNVTHYREHFPDSYFEKMTQAEQMYVLEDQDTARITAAAVLLTEDPRWKNPQGSAYYVHNLVSATDAKLAGAEIINRIDQLSREHGKTHLRLDCIVGNHRLNQWYERMGFYHAGTTVDGEYTGNLREKCI